MQVFSRLILVWGISKPFPELDASPFYTSMLLAYGMTEVIRYGYFVMKLVGFLPYVANWLRYSAFLVLYPLGISSEYALMILAFRGPAANLFPWYPWAVASCLAIWPPSEFEPPCILRY
jgi:very-long-chain (3R)-3-hydroxyacyl-CoA dehydratase